MYQVGDQVLYGMHGVCRIAGEEKRILDKNQTVYLVLEPLNQEGTQYFVPEHNAAAMAKLRPILTKQELDVMLRSSEIRQQEWIRDENLRKQTYRELITSGNRTALMGMLFMLYRHRLAQSRIGKKVHLADENFLKDAEKLLAEEISVTLGMTTEQAKNFLREQLKSE